MPPLIQTLIQNPKAFRDYEILEQFEAGLQLRGFEVKAVKNGRAQIVGARVVVVEGEAYLAGAEIAPYQPHNLPADYQRGRDIKLLLTKTEIGRLAGSASQKGLTIIPLSLYHKNGNLKLKIAVARGRKQYDKRELIKQKETRRQIERTLKRRYRG